VLNKGNGSTKSQPVAADSAFYRDDDDVAPGKVVNFAQARAQKKAKGPSTQAKHVLLAEAIQDALFQKSERIIYVEGEGACWYGLGLWEQMNANKESDRLGALIDEACTGLNIIPTARLVSEVQKQMRRTLQVKKVDWDQHGKIAIIGDKPVLLDPLTLKTEDLKPEHYATYGIKVDLNPKAKCPQWLQMLKDCFGDRETIKVIQEVAGASLLNNKPRALTRVLLLMGNSNTGKSNILEVLTRLLSDDPITVPFESLENAHGTAPFQRNAPWLLHEAFEHSKWHPSATVKALASGDPISINIKNGPQITHTFRSPIFWASNLGPQFKDASRAMERRMIIVPCHKEFDDKNPVGVALEAQRKGYERPWKMIMATEKAGVLNWALAGLSRLMKRGFYELTDAMHAALQDMREESNYMEGFFGAGHAEKDPKCMVLSQDLCAAITMWHSSQYGEDRRMLSNKMISKQINFLYDRDIVAYPSNGNNFYIGVRLTDNGLEFWNNKLDMFGRMPPGKLSATSSSPNEVNKPAAVSLDVARALRVQRRASLSAYQKNRRK
jgi:putative DNA primase/helicase